MGRRDRGEEGKARKVDRGKGGEEGIGRVGKGRRRCGGGKGRRR